MAYGLDNLTHASLLDPGGRPFSAVRGGAQQLPAGGGAATLGEVAGRVVAAAR